MSTKWAATLFGIGLVTIWGVTPPPGASARSLTPYTDRAAFLSGLDGPVTIETFGPEAHLSLRTGTLSAKTEQDGIRPGLLQKGATYTAPITGAPFEFNIDAGSTFPTPFLAGTLGTASDRPLTVLFTEPVSAFGFDTNHLMSPRFSMTVRFVDGTTDLVTIPVSSEALPLQFFGFASTGPPIGSVTLSAHSPQSGITYTFALDNFAFAIAEPWKPAAGTIVIAAGSGRSGSSRDGTPATSAWFANPWGIVVDREGRLVIADNRNHQIRRVDGDGILRTIAGIGLPRFSGDGGPAKAAGLWSPEGMAIDAEGNLIVADAGNHRIRVIGRDGVIRTLAGRRETGGFHGDGGPAVQARLNFPTAVCVDPAGNVFVADRGNHRVRRITPDGIITTVAGSGFIGSGDWPPANGGFSGDGGPATAALLNGPAGVAVDKAGNLYIADYGNRRVRRVGPDGIIHTVAGDGQRGGSLYVPGDGGPAIDASLSTPMGLAVDDAGNLYIADQDAHRVRRLSPDGRIVTVAGTGSGTFPEDVGLAVQVAIRGPHALFVDRGDLLIAGTDHRVRRVIGVNVPPVLSPATPGSLRVIAGTGQKGFSGDGGPAIQALLDEPHRVAVDQAGNRYVSDGGRVRRIDPNGVITTFAGGGSKTPDEAEGRLATEAQFSAIWGLAVDGKDYLFMAGPNDNRIWKVSPSGVLTSVTVSIALSGPEGLAFDGRGRLYIGEAIWGRILRIGANGIAAVVAGGNERGGLQAEGARANDVMLGFIGGIAVNAQGDLFFTDWASRMLWKVGPDGRLRRIAGGGTRMGIDADGHPATAASFHKIGPIAIDSAGTVFLVDSFDSRAWKITPDGILHEIAEIGRPGSKSVGVSLDGAGSLYLANPTDSWIQELVGATAPMIRPGPFRPGSGDVHEDGRVTLQDATLALRIAVGLVTEPSPEQVAAADVAGHDRRVTLADILMILRIALGNVLP